MGSSLSRLIGALYRAPDDGQGGGGQGGGDAGGGQGGQGGGQGGQGGQGGGQGGFADAATARTFLAEYVPDADFLKNVPDDKVLPWASHVKGRVDEFGQQFPADWRKLVAGDNAEHMKTLERFQSPKALYDSYAALRSKLSSGELRAITPYPEKGTDEQKTAWRRDNGLPEKPEGYEIKLPDGVVIGEDKKGMISEFQKHAFETNMPPAAFNSAIAFSLRNEEAQVTAKKQADQEFRAQAEDELRAEWGTDYRGNLNRVQGFLDMAPQGVKDAIAGARAADGTPLGNHPQVLRWLVSLAREVNPSGSVLPGAGGDLGKSIGDEIQQIEAVMRDDRQRYNKDEKMQARLRDLYAARERYEQKKAA